MFQAIPNLAATYEVVSLLYCGVGVSGNHQGDVSGVYQAYTDQDLAIRREGSILVRHAREK